MPPRKPGQVSVARQRSSPIENVDVHNFVDPRTFRVGNFVLSHLTNEAIANGTTSITFGKNNKNVQNVHLVDAEKAMLSKMAREVSGVAKMRERLERRASAERKIHELTKANIEAFAKNAKAAAKTVTPAGGAAAGHREQKVATKKKKAAATPAKSKKSISYKASY